MKVSSIFAPCGSNSGRIVLASWLLASVYISGVEADSTTPSITPEAVVRFLLQDSFVSPGIGFQKVKIGQTFKQVAENWGNPNKAGESSDTGYGVWEYDAGDSKIRVSGGSTVTSSVGASFGMTPQQVITIYGSPTDPSNLAKLRYPGKGIEFGFEHGALKWISVFSPKS